MIEEGQAATGRDTISDDNDLPEDNGFVKATGGGGAALSDEEDHQQQLSGCALATEFERQRREPN
eukprot:10499029-Prorocentrum_lima.AAC.1